jgi:hypothetical protein
VASYEKTEELAPGWFHCRADLHVARALWEGRIDHETFRTLEAMDEEPDAEKRTQLAMVARLRAPDLAVIHLHAAHALADLSKPAEAREACERGLRAGGDVDVRTRLLVELARLTSAPLQRMQHLEEAISLSGNLVAAAMAKVMLRGGPEA